jgi:hypothetical protein
VGRRRFWLKITVLNSANDDSCGIDGCN